MTLADLERFQHFFDARDAPLARTGITRDPVAFLTRLAHAGRDAQALARYARACPVPGATPDDYAPRCIELSPTCSVIARIHFRGLDRLRPFVDVSAQSGPLPVSLGELYQRFGAFLPRAARVWQAPDEPQRPGAEPDLLVVAGHLPALLERPAPASDARITLRADPKLDSFEDYLTTYEALMRLEPRLSELTQPEDRASLDACAETGAFFRVLVDEEPAGFVAGRPDTFRAWSGWCIVEEVLEPAFRGHGLAPAVQRALLARLDPSRASSVFGTIHARNAPSLGTARRVGRPIVEVGVFLPFQ